MKKIFKLSGFICCIISISPVYNSPHAGHKHRLGRSCIRNMLGFILLLCSFVSCGTYKRGAAIPEETFTRDTIRTAYTEFRTGNYPLIITIPHGGKILDSTLIPRTRENCPDPKFAVPYDSHTPELGELIDSIVFARTGKYPYMVFMKLKRTYIDVNRELTYAVAQGSREAEQIYNVFYEKIAEAKKGITDTYGSGLLLDLHAHGHAKQEVEIGYQIPLKQMNLSDGELNSSGLEKQSGIYNLVKTNKQNLNFAVLLRGDLSFGTLLFQYGTPCIPHSANKTPGETKYFSGGFLTRYNGSGNGGCIDAIQLEFNRDSRKEVTQRIKTAENIVSAVEKYLNLHYNLKKYTDN